MNTCIALLSFVALPTPFGLRVECLSRARGDQSAIERNLHRKRWPQVRFVSHQLASLREFAKFHEIVFQQFWVLTALGWLEISIGWQTISTIMNAKKADHGAERASWGPPSRRACRVGCVLCAHPPPHLPLPSAVIGRSQNPVNPVNHACPAVAPSEGGPAPAKP